MATRPLPLPDGRLPVASVASDRPHAPAIYRGATARMFDSDFFEFFSKVHPAVPAILFVPVVAWFAFQGWEAATPARFALALGGGVLFWTFLEYSLHRFVFHIPDTGPITHWINFTFHGVHHCFPDDPRRLVMVPSVSIPLAVGFWFLFDAVLPADLVAASFAGLVSGYLLYDYSHCATHYVKPPKHPLLAPLGRFMRVQRARHMRHHFGDPELDYGVSVGIWDTIFDTAPSRTRGSGSTAVNKADPRTAPSATWKSAWARTLIRDPRDLYVVETAVDLSLRSWIPALILFAVPGLPWFLGILYLAVVIPASTDRFTLMLHVVSHRPLFARKVRWLNHWIPVGLGLFFGQTPYTYYAHHIGMHHAEGNLLTDLSTTMRLRGDSRWDFAKYAGRFFFLGTFDLARYMAGRKQRKLLRMVILGELLWLAGVIALASWQLWPTLFVFVLPVAILRVAMMQGNWAQHAFVDLSDPNNPYKNSVNLINSRHNRRCFNDGYHIVHHCSPSAHWTDHPVEFEKNLEAYASNDAMVFAGVDDFIVLWGWLMKKDYDRMADHFVDLSGQDRTKDEIIALLRSRTARPQEAA